MNKKILVIFLSIVTIVSGIAALSAFEAHVINVTAHIENALSVDTQEISFGTVFPQEYLERAFTISLSDSFIRADRADNVEYVIKQKTKCKLDPAYQGDMLPTYAPVNYWDDQCPANYLPMLSLCDYLSKLPQDGEGTDIGEPSYYDKDTNSCPPVTAPIIAHGKLAKSESDTTDNWIVDLKVPPVAGFVGQDWPEGCPAVDENDMDYGCDLWIEVTDIYVNLPLPWLNEIHYDNEGTDVNEGIEIAGQAGINLSGWSVVFYNGNGGASYGTLNLSGTIPNQQANYGTLWFYFAGFQNGAPDGLALVNPSNEVIQFLSYEGSFMATDGPANGLMSVDIGVDEDPAPPVGQSLQLQGIGHQYADFIWTGPIEQTYGNINTNQTFN